MSDTITAAGPPTSQEAAATILAFMAAQSGVVTDYNEGSQIRTIADSIGAALETQGVIAKALAFQALVYSAYAVFNIVPFAATFSVGTVTFTPPSASPQSVVIPTGTTVQTAGGTQFQTNATVTLAIGATSVSAPIVAAVAGAGGNTPTGSITQIVTGLPVPLTVTNALKTDGGFDQETPAQTLSRFSAAVAALGEASPVSIANACIGVASGAEIVRYVTVYEPWVVAQGGGTPFNSLIAGFQVYIDNGSGAASSALIAATKAVLDGNQKTDVNGFRPAGVPYAIAAVTPVLSSVTIVAGLIANAPANTLATAITAAVNAYYASLQFGDTVQQTRLVAAVGVALSGYVTSLSVTLLDGTGTPQTAIAATAIQRNILTTLTQSFV